ncbi:unnamed protein product [Owenia fusiformis]|uniref:Uncharacterized protein n=1 Tax=Owenia fusiformis TaxID=6347 RepID=A0A8J1TIJ1_OWEFU|nr:unnamed protein product [Owenia fusiformis]
MKMEFPDLGKNCSEKHCKKLDFLPMKCDACRDIFCKDHIQYEVHECKESYKKDNWVPLCPLCSKPIPVKPGETPDIQVGRHIDSDCQSDPAKERRGKVYTNRCNNKGCKTKELVPVICDKCHLNYCLKHRHETDHNCQGFQGTNKGISKAGAAAARRNHVPSGSGSKPQKSSNKPQQNKPQQTTLTNYGFGRDLNRERQERMRGQQGNDINTLQAGMSEDEAMARALQLSMQTSDNTQPTTKPTTQQEEQEAADLALARAIAESEAQASNNSGNNTNRESKDRSCMVS